MRNCLYAILIGFTLTIVLYSTVKADADKHLKKGYISNNSSEKCWYAQRTDRDNIYFYGMKHVVGIITFDDPSCMSGKDLGEAGLGINKMMINNVISKWYSHSDSGFMTKESELFSGSMMQKKGKCIYSKTYPKVVGIAVDYHIRNKFIHSVTHGASLMGCTK